MLADLYNWFIAGFDTADLKNAKAQHARSQSLDSSSNGIFEGQYPFATTKACAGRGVNAG